MDAKTLQDLGGAFVSMAPYLYFLGGCVVLGITYLVITRDKKEEVEK